MGVFPESQTQYRTKQCRSSPGFLNLSQSQEHQLLLPWYTHLIRDEVLLVPPPPPLLNLSYHLPLLTFPLSPALPSPDSPLKGVYSYGSLLYKNLQRLTTEKSPNTLGTQSSLEPGLVLISNLLSNNSRSTLSRSLPKGSCYWPMGCYALVQHAPSSRGLQDVPLFLFYKSCPGLKEQMKSYLLCKNLLWCLLNEST